MTDRTGQRLGQLSPPPPPWTRRLRGGLLRRTYLFRHARRHQDTLYTACAGHIEQFQREARMLANLAHPHIVRVLDFGIDDHTPYLVMDYAPGGTLRTRYPRGTRLSVPTVVTYAKQFAQALQYAHDQKATSIPIVDILIG